MKLRTKKIVVIGGWFVGAIALVSLTVFVVNDRLVDLGPGSAPAAFFDKDAWNEDGCPKSKYLIERGKVEYTMSGYDNGTSVLYFKDYGDVTREDYDFTSPMDGGSQRNVFSEYDFHSRDFHVRVEPDRALAFLGGTNWHVGGCMPRDEYEDGVTQGEGFEKGEFLGKECEYMFAELGPGKSCVWNGVTLHSFVHSSNDHGLIPDSQTEETAISFTEDFDDSVFLLPKGYTIVDDYREDLIEKERAMFEELMVK